MRIVRTALAAAVMTAAVGFAGSALAQEPVCTTTGGAYPVITCTAGALSTTIVNVDGNNVTVRVQFPDGTFKAFEVVAIEVQSTPQHVATVTANARGGVDATITLPDNLEIGTHTIVAKSASGVVARIPFRVVANGGAGDPDGPAGQAGGGGLTRTGSDSTLPLAVSGVTLVLLGGAMVVVARRSNSSSPLAA